MMTKSEIEIVQTSWSQVMLISDHTASLFYENLLTLDPSLKALFKGDHREQGGKLVDMLDTVVQSLDALGELDPEISAPVQRHLK
jgi:hemoglobin-like flavoprotein